MPSGVIEIGHWPGIGFNMQHFLQKIEIEEKKKFRPLLFMGMVGFNSQLIRF